MQISSAHFPPPPQCLPYLWLGTDVNERCYDICLFMFVIGLCRSRRCCRFCTLLLQTHLTIVTESDRALPALVYVNCVLLPVFIRSVATCNRRDDENLLKVMGWKFLLPDRFCVDVNQFNLEAQWLLCIPPYPPPNPALTKNKLRTLLPLVCRHCC